MSKIRLVKKVISVFFLLFCSLVFADDFSPNLEELEELEKLGDAQELLQSQNVSNFDLYKDIVIVESVVPHDLNPQTTAYSVDSAILSGLYEGLVSNNPKTLEPEFAIAVSYKISRDKKRWTFILRDDAYFSNGEKITADAVRKSFLMLLANPNAPYASLIDIVRGAENYRKGIGKSEDVGIVVNAENKITFVLNSPANYFLSVLCHTAFSIVHEDSTVFSGPFILASNEYGVIELLKNENYWDKNNVKLEKITFLQSDDKELNTQLFNTGDVHWISAGNVDTNKIINKKALQFSGQFGTTYMFFKLQENEDFFEEDSEISLVVSDEKVWNKKEFRNAVLEAFPWDEIRKNVSIPATTFVYPLAGYPPVNGFSYTDEVEAVNMMNEARRNNDIGEEEIIPLVFEVSTGFFSENQKQIMKNALLPLNVDLQIVEIHPAKYLRSVASSEADLFLYSWTGDFADPLAFLELFRGNSTLNDSNWKNEEFDRLIEEAAIASVENRFSILAKAEEILLDEGMIIPLQHPLSLNVINLKEIGGWAVNAFDFHPLKYLYRNHIEIELPNVVKDNIKKRGN
ncbi:MAG: peptide ABC transporter substrate-binding protein [Treponema sp.]|nr:peptide ABC transporter substrate-binding protein [Treponema sp.]